MGSEILAANGGTPEISGLAAQLPFRGYQLRRGLSRSLDLMRMLPLTLRGVTSVNMGGVIGQFENAFCRLTGSRYALAMTNGTATLHSAYFAVGVGPGTEVIVPSYTWHATATPVLLCGATPVFCDIDPRTLTLDPDAIEAAVTERTRAICVLHAWGNPAPMDRIMDIARRHDLAVVEDCSHAHGASYQGKSVGTWGDVGCFSLQGSKTVDAGEGGVATTQDPELYDRMVLLGHNYMVGGGGQKADTFPFGDISLGVKYRPHLAAMVLGLGSLKGLPKRNAHAARSWEILCEELADAPGIRAIETTPGGVRNGYYAFVFEYQGEDFGGPDTPEFVRLVRAEGASIDVDQYRDTLLHTLPLFRDYPRNELGGGYDPTRPFEEQLSRVELPVTERLAKRLVRFPREFNVLSHDFVRRTAKAVKKVLNGIVPAGANRIPETAGGAPEPMERAASRG